MSGWQFDWEFVRCDSHSPQSWNRCDEVRGHEGAHEARLEDALSAAWSHGADSYQLDEMEGFFRATA